MVAERPTPAEVPVPVRFTVCGLPVALSVNTTAAVRVPAALGVNVTLSVHWLEAESEEPQVLVKLKSPALAPVTWMLENVKVALPTLINVADAAALVVPTAWLAKVTVVGLIEKPAVETGTTTVPPPPPQDMDPRAIAIQAAARITGFPPRR